MKKKNFNAADFFGKFGIVIILILLVALFSVLNAKFISIDNIVNILRQVAITGIIAVGMTMVLVTGGIDLSVGSVAGMGTVFCAMMLLGGMPWPVALLICVVGGFVIGVINAFLINRLSIPPLIATLGMCTSLRGVCYLVTAGKPVFGFPGDILFLGKGSVLGIPWPVIIMVIVFILGILFLQKTRYGTYIYGIGGNEEACRLAGVNIKKLKYFIYMFSGFLAGLSACVLLSRVNSGQPKAGTGFEFEVITAVVLGGVSIKGGAGNIWGVLVGVLIMGIMKNGFVLMNVNEYLQMVLQGFVLLAAVSFDILMNRPAKLTKEKILEDSAAKQA